MKNNCTIQNVIIQQILYFLENSRQDPISLLPFSPVRKYPRKAAYDLAETAILNYSRDPEANLGILLNKRDYLT